MVENLVSMIWIEQRKAVRSNMPLWTALGSLFMPAGMTFLIYAARNPEVVQKLGLVGAKANLFSFSATGWSAYLDFMGLLIAAGGFIFFNLIISWVFGREFADGTLKDMLAVPVHRASIVLAKYLTVAVWCFALMVVILLASLIMGSVIQLPEGSIGTILRGSTLVLAAGILTIFNVMPFALLASAGRGYLLPVGIAILTLMTTNLVIVLGWGPYFPWAVPGLLIQDRSSLEPISYWIVLITGLSGIVSTYLWWKYADQSR